MQHAEAHADHGNGECEQELLSVNGLTQARAQKRARDAAAGEDRRAWP